MTMTAERADLAALTDEELARAYGADGADVAALRAEEDRREALRHRKHVARHARWNREDEWYETAHAQFLQAEAECSYLVNNRGRYRTDEHGRPDPVDPWSLWNGSDWHVRAYQSWELERFWETHPRITRAEWNRQTARAKREENDDQLDRDDRSGVRQDAGAGPQDPAVHSDGGRDDVSPPDAGDQPEAEDDPGARADGGRGAAVRPVVLTAENPVTVIPGRAGDQCQHCGGGIAHHAPTRVCASEACYVHTATGAHSCDPDSLSGSMAEPQSQPDRVAAARARLEARRAVLAAERAQRPAEPPAMQAPAPVADHAAEVAVRAPGTVVAARQEVDGDQVLRYLFTFLKRFAVWGSDAEIVTAALWIAQAHARDGDGMPIWQYCARLGIFGPSGSGKSRKCRLIGKLAPSGAILLEPTKPSFIDMVADKHTVIITEADEMFYTSGRNRGILAVVNASYEPDRENTRKHGGKVVKVTLFGHVVLDGLDVMLQATRPDLRTMISRTIVMMSAMAPEGYRPPRFDGQARGVAALLGQRAAAWMAQEVAGGLADDVPDVPEHLGNRPFALWEPLFAVAARADRSIARREGAEPDGPGPWWRACAEACEVLEAGAPVIDEAGSDMAELDRAMAEWGEAS